MRRKEGNVWFAVHWQIAPNWGQSDVGTSLWPQLTSNMSSIYIQFLTPHPGQALFPCGIHATFTGIFVGQENCFYVHVHRICSLVDQLTGSDQLYWSTEIWLSCASVIDKGVTNLPVHRPSSPRWIIIDNILESQPSWKYWAGFHDPKCWRSDGPSPPWNFQTSDLSLVASEGHTSVNGDNVDHINLIRYDRCDTGWYDNSGDYDGEIVMIDLCYTRWEIWQ